MAKTHNCVHILCLAESHKKLHIQNINSQTDLQITVSVHVLCMTHSSKRTETHTCEALSYHNTELSTVFCPHIGISNGGTMILFVFLECRLPVLKDILLRTQDHMHKHCSRRQCMSTTSVVLHNISPNTMLGFRHQYTCLQTCLCRCNTTTILQRDHLHTLHISHVCWELSFNTTQIQLQHRFSVFRMYIGLLCSHQDG